MTKGADALVIEGVHTETTGRYTSTYGNNDGPKWVITEDGKLKDAGKGSSSSTSISTETKEKVNGCGVSEVQVTEFLFQPPGHVIDQVVSQLLDSSEQHLAGEQGKSVPHSRIFFCYVLPAGNIPHQYG